MSDLKSYTCARCGAALNVDKLQGQMSCPFCGNEFDYIDFHREELMLQAEKCLARGAYKPAREKFSKVLENDPADIVAYRGLILCAGRVRSTKDLKERYRQAGGNLYAIKRIVASAKENVTKEDADYLDKLVCLFEIHNAYKSLKKRRKETYDLERIRELQLEAKKETDEVLIHVLVISMYAVLALVCWIVLDGEGLFRPYLITAIIAIIALNIFLFVRFRVNVVKIPDKSSSLTDKLEYVEDKHLEFFDEVLEYEETFKNRPQKTAPGRSTEKKRAEPEITGTVICSKCGGMLKLNAAGELYECNSCGVSYGKYLFFGDLTANAVRAMKMGEFDEADQILSHKLMLNPRDFEALFGRFLCAGEWESLKDIDINDNMFMSHVRNLPDKLNAIEMSISKEDQPLWKEIRVLSDILAEYSVKRREFNRANAKYSSVCGKLNNTYLMPEEVTVCKIQENELWEQITSIERECKAIKERLNETVKVLTDAESKCIFFWNDRIENQALDELKAPV
ncbi:MAG: hypothetical protein K6E12_11715 [Saccharofermentans sp.]|nr:hypothetical protein [Saccharofermentans sp.]